MLTDTELRLSYWRDGSTKAERLAASALRLSGYEEIDPQSPLGGPDGKKDILCRKGGLTWVGAVYFPSGPARFAAIKKKYLSDLQGAPAEPGGFAFVTNQSLTPAQRKTLIALALTAGKEADILHLHQLINLLDAASGYGIRIQYLQIPMTIEEQLSWSVESDSQTAKALSANTRELLALRASVDRIGTGQEHIIRTLGFPNSAPTADLISLSSFQKNDDLPGISGSLSPALVLLFHRLVCFDLPSRAVGQLRTNQVWLGNSEGRRAAHVQPPPAEQIGGLLATLCDEWNAYSGLRTHNAKLEAAANFHARFLVIHPFLDGNGRVARAILMQQCLDLFGRADMALLNKGSDYYAALQAADAGNNQLLAALIDPVVRG